MSLNPIKSALSTFKLVLKETEHKSVSPLTKLLFEATLILSALIIYSMLYRIIEGDITAYLKPVFIAAQVTWLEQFVVWFFPLLVCGLRFYQHVSQLLRSRFFQKHGASIITPQPHYFRLLPYQTADKSRYHRADNLHIEVKNWIKQSAHTLLYLSGESGAGKSSLLNAYLVPELNEDGYVVISCSAHADPILQLKQAVLEHLKSLHHSGDGSLPEAETFSEDNENWIKSLNQYCQIQTKPVLLIIDQFEEFLIMADQSSRLATSREALHNFINRLNHFSNNDSQQQSCKVLFTFRSDYDGLIHDLQLPPMRSRDNWFKISAFSHQAAIHFLQNGMHDISNEQIENILQSVSELEDRKGLYRPITLNFAGYLLMNNSVTASLNMNKLIQQFFVDLVQDRKHGTNLRQLLPLFITAQDTKHPVNIARMAEQSQITVSAVISSLNFLAEKGLAKPLDSKNSYWELSHDFIARKIAPVLHHYRTPIRQRIAQHSIAISVGIWAICVAGISLYALKPNQNVPLIVEQIMPLNNNGDSAGYSNESANISGSENQTNNSRPSGIRFKTPFLNDVTLAYLPAATAQKNLDWHGVKILDLSDQIGVAHLQVLQLPREMHTLIAEGTGIFTLQDIKWPRGVQHLSFRNTELTDINNVIWPDNLQTLNLSQNKIRHVQQVNWPQKLLSLDLRDTQITHLSGIQWPESLQALYANWSEIQDLSQMQWPQNVAHLDLSLTSITNLEDINWPAKLSTLQLRYTNINDLAYAQWPRNLQNLDLSGTSLTDIHSAYWPAKLQHLSLAWTKVSDISRIRWPKSLLELNLSSTIISQLNDVNWPPHLQTLDLSSTNLTSLRDINWPDSLTGLDLRRTDISDTELANATWPANLQVLGCHEACIKAAEQTLGRKLQNLDTL